jgi:energy-coupling factor transporter ATP-binding protein EcfA2
MAKTTKKVVAKQGRSDESPVYFLSLEVENVLCFKDKQVLDLTNKNGNPAQWTVILGDNGVGKTTLLRCLAQMDASPLADNARARNMLGLNELSIPVVSSWLNNLPTPVETELHIQGKVTHGNLLSALQVSSDARKLILSGYMEMTFELGHYFTAWVWQDLQGLVCFGYGAIRNLGSGALSENIWKDNSLSLFTEGAPLINAEEWMLQTDYAYQTATGELKKRLEKQLGQIFDILKRILPDVNDIKIAPATEDNPHPRAEFLTPYGWVHINSLGLGYRTAIAWMVDLAVRLFRRYPNSPDPLAEPAIVLVDEIDLHLHPRWQRTIMDFLTERFPNTQFIVTAHSPLVVQAAQNANIVLLRREGDRVVIDNNPEIIENWRVDQVLTSVFDLQTARPKEVEPLLLRREALLDQSKLSKKDQAELDQITEQLGDLPTAESPQEIKAMNIIRRAAKYLESK